MKKKLKPDPLDRSDLINRATALLGRRDYSRQELWRKLSPLAESTETLNEVLDYLATLGWQSDQRFTSQLVNSLVRRGRGPLRISRDLSGKGIDQSMAEEAIGQTDEISWYEAARAEAVKKLRTLKLPLSEARPKLYRFLLYRGFTPDIIQSVLQDPVLSGEEDTA
ncbi:MAG: hypothetical protein CMI00_14705 [Oceanospirillaceae bacterium]|nr:hypothetical protein [Oceanospirillaceae bacterium]MAR01773.1 hypothetical protein [Oceanospirillaceae bacterium]|tara:strand:+ start:1263 stop:1760 length:498 start_codon:yes stop_codon:yes gene_type:complete